MSTLSILGGVALLGGLWHADDYRLRRRSILRPHPDGQSGNSLRILHISDPHLLARQEKRRKFIRELAHTRPDFVVVTGDLISEDAAIDALLADLEPLLEIPGAFVFGSNDYYAPRPANPFRYLWRHTGGGPKPDKERDEEGLLIGPNRLDTKRLRRGLTSKGWLDLNNRRGRLTVRGWNIELVGVDDPHILRDQMPDPVNDAASQDSASTLRIALAHAPYTRVLDAFIADGADVIFCGHTHGGQVNLPKYGALVTNCDLDKRFANGMFRWPVRETTSDDEKLPIKTDGAIIDWSAYEPTEKSAIVQLSAGLGNSPYTPVRTFCPPEAIQIDILPL
ncbi:MAG: metallophosphoesterase [Actinomycetaceae bacterium]|nr:metallophosphoesterase [Actinomycetaceae bacterium]